MEKTIQIFIYMHAAFGGIALITGFISMVAKKGKTIHKKSGLLFFYSMMLSGIIALVVAVLPKHESPFLFAVGIFSLYFVLTGKRALHFKLEKPDLRADKWISKIMILTGVLMILLPIVLTKRIHIVLVVFAIIGIVFSARDLKLFKNPEQLRKGWLKLHLGKMIGGYISATTAFVVVNEYFPSFYGWFIPGIIGGFIIAYWMRKLKTKTIANTLQN